MIRNRHSDPSAAERSAGEVNRDQAVVEGLQRYVDGHGQAGHRVAPEDS